MPEFITSEHTPKLPSKGYLAFIIGFLCVGIGLTVGISAYGATILHKLKNYTVITATVIDHKISESWSESDHGAGSSKVTYAEIANFNVDGTTYTVTNNISSTGGVKNIGDPIRIAYNPEDPYDCIFLTQNNKLGLTVAFILGIVFTLSSVFMLTVYIIRYKDLKKSQSLQ